MPQHDCFCAICSASVWCATIRQRKAEGDKSPELKEDDESERGYDPEVVSKEYVNWIENFHILGFNSQAPGVSKAFVSGWGWWDTYFDTIKVTESDDPNLPDDDGDEREFRCYVNYDDDLEDVVFPFHWSCYKLFARCLTGSTIEDEDVFDNIDKDLLYKIMSKLCNCYPDPLKLNYGEPAPTIDGFEDAFSGQELFVVSPLSTPALQSAIEAIVESNNFTIPRSSDNIGLCVKQDDFSKLPSELIHKIVDMLPAEPLLMLSRASWTVNCVLRNNEIFWKERIRCDWLWFFELQYPIDSPNTFQGKYLKGMFLWAHEISKSRLWMKGAFLGLANRRRIWGVCEQLKEEYLSGLKQIKDGPEPNFVKNEIQERSTCVYSPVVCSPIPEKQKGSAVYWVHSWEDVFVKPKVLEIFWSYEGSLVGLSLALENGRRLFGMDDKTKGVFKEFIEVESGVWITGFVLHIPVFEDKHFWNEREMRKKVTSIRGLTVIYNTGKSSCFGSTQQRHARLPLLGASSHFITGISGQLSRGENSQRIVRLGLLQSKRPVVDDYSEDPGDYEVDIPYPTDFEDYLWSDDCSSILVTPIWEHPTMREVILGGRESRNYNFVQYEPLIWGASEQELRSLTSLCGYVPTGSRARAPAAPFPSGVRSINELCGISAHFGGGHGSQRVIGLQKESDGGVWTEENSSHFEIDGPGGEYINEISVHFSNKPPNGLKLRTNSNREFIWSDHQTGVWETFQAPEGEVIVGMILKFGRGVGWLIGDNKYTRTKMRSLSALTIPLGIADGN